MINRKEKKALLFGKRSKNFCHLGRALNPRRTSFSKVFWFFFSKKNCFLLGGLGGSGGGVDDADDVAFLHHQQVFTGQLHFGAGPFAEQDAVADLNV